MKWTSPEDIKEQLERSWLRGDICRASVRDTGGFPLAIALRQPSAKVMLDDFANMQDWVKLMRAYAQKKQLKLEYKQINHRALGQQELPSHVLLHDPQQAATLIAKMKLLKIFCHLYKKTGSYADSLQAWVFKYPIKVLELADQWQQILDLCVWMQANPQPKIYLRQVDVTGVDSKFIEQHKKVLAALFDLMLPVFAIDDDFSGALGFARRYGFLDKPLMLRVRPLDANITLLPCQGHQDVMLTAKALACIHSDVQEQVKAVFVVENEVNYLSFPDMPNALLIFGSGYGFEALKEVKWLTMRSWYYWGDLDTHGFAILDQLRCAFPHVRSFLMDKNTFMRHEHAWGNEPKQEKKDLHHLNETECEMYDILRFNDLGEGLRLEQERIAYVELLNVLKDIDR
ncbi:MAG: DUF2220 family protein [Mariprofundaceae bacterium]|nr:DUF2220 family protein [Mariprofundaceae bacterium]